ncbi:hypothetical protein BDV25DRAFT_136222 [Aspergillus avenaceus]|uniref:Heterokaryon incompatibility domain-containing protein n=1 Tax=Aspergillus avenaceus TaxID=36643 RepID=A0A5N6U608_ASPAV|nr:hypothetical protein BDV25DRAFT_136222 [Aspergillus avenaceus]
MIYGQAACVIVWLGASESGPTALKVIHRLGQGDRLESIRESYSEEEDSTDESDLKDYGSFYEKLTDQRCLALSQQNWFCRIWILQEVGVARYINVMSGSVRINGQVFCEGVARLRLPSRILLDVNPVAMSLGEPFDMYRTYKAT